MINVPHFEPITHWLTYLITDWLTDSITHWQTNPITDILTEQITDWLTHPITHWLTLTAATCSLLYSTKRTKKIWFSDKLIMYDAVVNVEDASWASQCLAICQVLASQGQEFSFTPNVGSNFTFNLDTKVKPQWKEEGKSFNQEEECKEKRAVISKQIKPNSNAVQPTWSSGYSSYWW